MNPRREALFLALLLCFALALRLYISATAFHGTFDTSTVGVMALDILEGGRPLFYYGQNYLGALEAYVAAAWFVCFGPSLFTLSLAPILFSMLWLGATWWMVRRLYGPLPALAAVAVFATPGWHSLWFNLASYGGYPGAFFFGTVAAALAVECWRQNVKGTRLILCIAGIGFSAGLALWTNFLSAPWLAIAAAACLPLAWKRRREPALWIGAVAGALFLLAASSPVWLSIGAYDGDPVSSWTWHRGLLRLRWEDFLRPGLRVMAFSDTVTPSWWRVFVGLTLTGGLCSYLAYLLTEPRWRQRLLALLPLFFMAIFLVMSLPHHLAATRAFRYLIPLWSALCVALFVVPVGAKAAWVRRTCAAVLVLFCLLQTGGAIGKAQRDAEFKQATIAARDRIDAASAELGHPPILVVGDRVLGYRAMNNNFWSGGQSQFASSFDDRNRRIAENVEAARTHLLATAPHYAERVENALHDLRVEFTRTDAGALILFEPTSVFSSAAPSLYPLSAYLERAGLPDEAAPGLVDRIWESGATDEYASATAIRIELPEEQKIDSIVLFATDPYQDGLPARFRIAALDAAGVETWSSTVGPRFSSAYTEDGRVFMKGYFGKLESRLDGVPAAAIRLEPVAGAGGFDRWSIHEIYIFPSGPAEAVDFDLAVAHFMEEVQREEESFIMAPRGLSAWVLAATPDRQPVPVFRRYNPRFGDTLQSRFFEPGMSVAVAEKYAPEVRRLLQEVYGAEAIREEKSLPPWRLFRTDHHLEPRENARLLWNGHVLVKTFEEEPVWHFP